jgi:sulfate adenylyltransferase subunit 2
VPYLSRLEGKSIYIPRKVVAECRPPVTLSSIDKESFVMPHLLTKPSCLSHSFPLMHIDTGWKFRETIAFRDAVASDYGLKLIVHHNAEGEQVGTHLFDTGLSHITTVTATAEDHVSMLLAALAPAMDA